MDKGCIDCATKIATSVERLSHIDDHIEKCDNRYAKLHELVERVLKCQEDEKLAKKVLADYRVAVRLRVGWWASKTAWFLSGVFGTMHLISKNWDAIKTFICSVGGKNCT